MCRACWRGTEDPRMMHHAQSFLRVFAGALLAAAMLWAGGCGDRGYSQETPDDVLRTARTMIERGEARKIGGLFYAENDDMRKVLDNFGVLLGNLQRLGQAVGENFPTEVEQLKTRAEDAAKKGTSVSFLSQIASQAGGGSAGRSRRAARDPERMRREQIEREQQFGDSLKSLFADPYGFLRSGADRLTTTPLSDDMAAVLWDGEPALAPLGMVMRRSADGRWYIVPPLNIPGLANYLPQNTQEYKVFGAMIAILNNVIVDLARDVREKRIRSIDDLSRSAGEKAFLPAAMGYVAYSRMIDERRKNAAGGATPRASTPTPSTPR